MGTNVKQWNVIRLLSIRRNVPSNLVIQLGVDFVKVSPYVFIIILVPWVFGRLKICHLVRMHSKNLFGYRDVKSGPVCVPTY